MPYKIALALGMIAVIAVTSVEAMAKPASKNLVLSCTAIGTTDISMQARYIKRVKNNSNKRQFKTEFEAAPNLGYAVGQTMTVTVAGIKVGTKKLKKQVNGDIGAELELESNNSLVRPFPANFPAVAAGTKVGVLINNVATLSCSLK